MKKEEVWICYNDKKIYGIKYLPNDVKKCPMVIFSHGYNGSGAGAEKYAKYLAERGIGAFCYDFCGGAIASRSSMDTTKMTLFTEKDDLLNVYEEVQKWEETDEESVFLFGESQGGLISALVAGELKDGVKGLILVFPAFCIVDNWNEKFKREEDIPEEEEFWGMKLGKDFFVSMRKLNIYKEIGSYRGKVLIIHGIDDAVVPVEYSIKAIDCYEDSCLVVFPHEGHGFSERGAIRTIEKTYEMIKIGCSI